MQNDFNSPPVSTVPPSLLDLLTAADLIGYLDPLRNVLKLRNAGDIGDTDQMDLDGIGMSRPEQKRLWREYAKYYPMPESICGKTNKKFGGLKKIKRKVLGRGGAGEERKATPEGKSDQNDQQRKEDREEQQQQPHRHIIPADRITLCKQIGSGEFGHVFQAAWHSGGVVVGDERQHTIQVAVKRILPEKLLSQHSSFLQEAAIMTRMQHDNVIRLYGVVLDTKVVMLVSELAPCGSLLECLQCPSWREPFSVATLADFPLQIAQGMRYLTSQRLIHRDLAARNVLVCTPNKVKISDFGLSRSLGHGEDYYRSVFSPTMKLPIAWCAPECINFLRFTSASDVWAYGVTLWEMFSYGRTPWEGLSGSQILHAIDTQRKQLACPEACPRELFRIVMQQCWEWEADKRCTFEQICEKMPALMPPMLVTVVENRGPARGGGQLQYEREEVIVLLDKNPPGQSGFWLGATKSGSVGLFRPEDTIAYLGAENPSSSPSNGDIPAQMPEIEEKNRKNKKEKKERKKEAKKEVPKMDEVKKVAMVISQPQGDLRHTCHVGADGRTFGLLSVDKSQFARALPPRISPRSPPAPKDQNYQLARRPSQPLPTAAACPSPLMSCSIVYLTPPRPPKREENGTRTAPGKEEDVMSRSVCYGQSPTVSSAEYSNSSATTATPSFLSISSPPSLPPKPPRFRPFTGPGLTPSGPSFPSPSAPPGPSPCSNLRPSKSVPNAPPSCSLPSSPPAISKSFEEKSEVEETDDDHDDDFRTMIPSKLVENDGNIKEEEEDDEEEEFLMRPASICCETKASETAKMDEDDEKGSGERTEEEERRIFCLLAELQQDLTNFSMQSLEDCSDGRALLDGEQRREREQNQTEERKKREREEALREHGIFTSARSSVIGMDQDEWKRREEDERKKALRKLRKEDGGFGGGGAEEGGRIMAQNSKRASVVSSILHLHKMAGGEERTNKVEAEEEDEGWKSGTSGNETNDSSPNDCLPRSAKEPVPHWSAEAHEAYKLLVQCGHTLKDTTALISPPVATEKSQTAKSASSRAEEPKMNGNIEYINTNLVGWKKDEEEKEEKREKVPNCDRPKDGPKAFKSGSTTAGAAARLPPPPVPPKPKIKPRINPRTIQPPRM